MTLRDLRAAKTVAKKRDKEQRKTAVVGPKRLQNAGRGRRGSIKIGI